MKTVKTFGDVPRFHKAELDGRVAAARTAVSAVAFAHPQRERILETFVALYREMESDDRLDGACHLIAALSHVVLAVQGIENELCVGEVAFSETFTGSHSWVEIGDLRFDVAMARPMFENPVYESASVLGSTEIPSGRKTRLVYGVAVALDAAGMQAASSDLAGFMSGFKRASGLDFWFWAQRTARGLGVTAKRDKLEAQYSGARWTYLNADRAMS